MYVVSQSSKLRSILHLLKENESLLLGKFAHEENIPKKVLLRHFTDEIEQFVNKSSICLSLRNKDQITNGVVLVSKAQYDSKHFGSKIGKLQLVLFDQDIALKDRQHLFQEVKKEATSQNFDAIFGRIGLDQFLTIQSLENNDAILTDVLVTFYIDTRSTINSYVPVDCKIVEASKGEEPALSKMASQVFKTDHFHLDPHLRKNKCDELYAKWVSNSLNGASDKVLVAKKGDEVLGFITCNVQHIADNYSYGIIDLIGVKSNERNKGIGFMLVKTGLDWFSKFTKSVYVGTQVANLSAVRLYERMGFKQVYAEADLHLWI